MDSQDAFCNENVKNVHCALTKSIFEINEVDLQKDIIEEALGLAQETSKEILKLIENILHSKKIHAIEERLIVQLGNLKTLLDSLIIFLRYLVTVSDVNYMVFDNLPRLIGSILLMIFTHCKESEQVYSSYFAQISQTVKELFKKCHELQTIYLEIMSTSVNFDMFDDNHIEILEEALYTIADIGEIVISLDTKTMSAVWKTYVVISEQYSDRLRDKFIHHKATKILCGELEKNISFLITNQTLNVGDMNRSLKISNFLLKIMIEINKSYCGFLSKKLDHVVSFTVHTYQHSVPILSKLHVRPPVIEGVKSYIESGMELLLKRFLCDSYFKQNFLHYSEQLADKPSQLGFLLLCIAIVKLLPQECEDTKNAWTNDIISSIFQLVDLYGNDFMEGYEFECVQYEKLSLYDYLLLNLTCLVLSTSDISVIEELLLQTILKGEIWSSVLASDILLIIVKYGSREFCYQQLWFLLSIVDELNKVNYLKNTPQDCFIRRLIIKIFTMLPEKHKLKICDAYPCEKYPRLWNQIFLRNLPASMMSTQNSLIQHTTLEYFDKFQLMTLDNFQETKNILFLLSILIYDVSLEPVDNYQRVSYGLLKLWRKMKDKLKRFQIKEVTTFRTQWFYDIAVLLCLTTGNLCNSLSETMWIEILEIVSTWIPYSPSVIKFSILQLVSSFIDYKIGFTKESGLLVSLLSKIFHMLFTHSAGLVHVICIDELKYFILNTINEESLLKHVEMKQIIRKVLAKKHNYHDIVEYENCRSKFIHRCENEVVENEVDSELTICLHTLKRESIKLSEMVKKSHLNKKSMDEFYEILGNLNSVKDKLAT